MNDPTPLPPVEGGCLCGAVRYRATFAPASHFAVETRIAAWHVDDGLPGQRLDGYAPIMERWKRAYGDDFAPGIAAARTT
jgi:hypothetical protein